MSVLVPKNTPYYLFSGPMYDALIRAWTKAGAAPELVPRLALYGVYLTAVEGSYGLSELAKKYHNYGGMKNGNKGWQKFESRDDFAEAFVNNIMDKYPMAMNASTYDLYMHYLFEGPYLYDPEKGEKQYSEGVRGAMNRVNKNIITYRTL